MKVERKRRAGEGPQGQGEECEFVVVARDAVGAQGVATRAPVDDRPLSISADLDADGLHRGAAGAAPVAGLIVDMARPEARRTVVAMPGAERLTGDVVAAADAGEALVVGPRFV